MIRRIVADPRLWVVMAAVLSSAPNAPGAITVLTTPSSGPTWSVSPAAGGKFNVALGTTIVNQPTTWSVRGAAADKIATITVSASVPQLVFVEVRGTTAGTPITSVDLIEKSGTSTVVVSELRTSGSVGTIRVNTIAGMNVAGDVTGAIELLQRSGGGEASLISAVVGGRIRGNVIVDYGGIFDLTATQGLGALGAPIQIRARSMFERVVAGDIYADINTTANAGWGVTGVLQTTTGPFVGSLTTAALSAPSAGKPAAILIAGNLDADIDIAGAVANQNSGLPVVSVTGQILPTRTFRIGSSLQTGAEMRVNAASGLAGQVIVNARNVAGAWQGGVRVGASMLGPVPAYTSTAATLGGGAVGLVPFAIHGGDCAPTSGFAVSGTSVPAPSRPWLVRFYGPVTWTGGSSPPVIVESRTIGSTGAWTDISACFSIGREPVTNPSKNVVALYPVRTMAGGHVYRVRPVTSGTNALRCDLALASNPAVAAGEASISVVGGCSGDANSDATVNFSDITAVLSNWGGDGGGCFNTVDVNTDGVVSFADVTVVLANWGVPCG